MVFRVVAVSPDGARAEFLRSASGEAALLKGLRRDGWAVASVSRADGAAARRRFRVPFFSRRVRALDVETGLRQLSSMLKAGIGVVSALETVADQSESRAAAAEWRSAASRVRSGSTFAGALAERRRVFGETTVRLAEVGEKTGELDGVLARAADRLEMRREMRHSVVNALAYPCVAILAAVATAAYLCTAVIPRLAEFLSGGGAELPAATRWLVAASEGVRRGGPIFCLWLAAAVAVWTLARLSPALREAEDALLLRLPAAGKILRLSGTALFARSMQIMCEAGVPVSDALESASRTVSNERLRRRAADARAAILRGSTLAAALAPATEFLPMLSRMAAVGETSGTLPEAFGETARFHEAALARAVKRLAMAVEPAMIVVTGGIAGFVYVAFFTALFSVAGAAA